MNNASIAVAPSPAGLLKSVRDERYSSLREYEETMKQARTALAYKLSDALDVLDSLSEKEFLEIVKTLDNGVTASDMLERFRKYKATGTGKKKRKKYVKPQEKKQEPPF